MGRAHGQNGTDRAYPLILSFVFRGRCRDFEHPKNAILTHESQERTVRRDAKPAKTLRASVLRTERVNPSSAGDRYAAAEVARSRPALNM